MAGIYIHIPFCKQACHYCNFHFSTSLRYKNELIAALLKEIELAPQIASETIETIYFGGGTPSLLTADELVSLLQAVRQKCIVSQDAEVTLEANPDDITREKLITWQELGINRLSIGIQSFFEEDLRWMNRAHNAKQANDHLRLALDYFPNITIDLIYGTPGLTDEKWKQNVEQAVAMGIPHLSCYALTVEPKTPLQKMIRLKESPDVDTDQQSRQFLLLMDWLKENGYEHYEISNFAKPGFRSRHNSSYWKGKPYTGIGPSAHSFDGKNRWWNIANNAQYIQSLNADKIPAEIEELTPAQQFNEWVMISLRTMEGLDTQLLQGSKWTFEPAIRERLQKDLARLSKKYIAEEMLQEVNGYWQLTNKGKLFADGIAADFFI